MRFLTICLTGLLLFNTSLTQAQQNTNDPNAGPVNNGPPKITGKVTDITEKGRLKVLHVTDDDGKEYEFNITPKINFEVHATGDQGFVREGQFVTAQGVLTNGNLFVRAVNVYLLPKGRKAPLGKVVKSARQAGSSVNTYDISGPVIAKQQSPDYPDYEMIAIKAAGKSPPIMLEKGYTVSVIQLDPSSAEKNAPIEMVVAPLRGGKFNLLAAKITLEHDLKSEDIFGPTAETTESK